MDEDLPHDFVIIFDFLDVQKNPEQVNRGNGDDRGGNFLFQAAGIELAQQGEFLRARIDIDARDKVFIAAEHDHYQQAANQRHIDQRKHHQYQIGFAGTEHQRKIMRKLLEELERGLHQRQLQAQVYRRQDPAAGVQHFFGKLLHISSRLARNRLPDQNKVINQNVLEKLDNIIIVHSNATRRNRLTDAFFIRGSVNIYVT